MHSKGARFGPLAARLHLHLRRLYDLSGVLPAVQRAFNSSARSSLRYGCWQEMKRVVELELKQLEVDM